MDIGAIKGAGRRYINVMFTKIGEQSIQPKPYKAWLKDFKLAHGELDTQRKINTAKLESLYDIKLDSTEAVFVLVYCLDNYYALFLTLAAARTLDEDYSHEKVRGYLDFSFFRKSSVSNFHPPANLIFSDNYFYLPDVSDHVAQVIENTGTVDISNTDFIREVFHSIYPSNMRHSLGEFYTPDWLARHVVEESLAENSSCGQYLDPTCGSGTFLITLHNVFREKQVDASRAELVGFDISPVSAFATKVNMIINQCVAHRKGERAFLNVFNTNILDFEEQCAEANHLRITNIEDLRKSIASVEEGEGPFLKSELDRLKKLEYIAPIFFNEVDMIVGNPPWVNWEYLPKEYKTKTAHIWQDYGLFDYKGMDSIFIKEDISALITYVCLDRFLKPEGRMSFVVKESLFKSAKQATGFRKFHLQNTDTPFRILKVEDLTAFKPFYGVANKTVIFYAQKGTKTTYPVDYVIWEPKGRKTFKDTESYSSVMECFRRERKLGTPVNRDKKGSSWASISRQLHDELDKYLGTSAYRARTGVFTGGANGIYWLNILQESSPTLVSVNNMTERAKIKFRKVTADIEKDLVFPYMSGSELKLWETTYSKYIICPHTKQSKMQPLKELHLAEHCPYGMGYFNGFKKELQKRKGFTSFDRKIHEENFFALQRIGDYTFAPYKVAWKYIASSFTCAVIEDTIDEFLGSKTIIPNEKLIYIGLDDKAEAYYLCGLLSSTKYRELVNSFKISTQIAPSVISNLNIPRFDKNDEWHNSISKACASGHKDKSRLDECLGIIDEAVERTIGNRHRQTNKVAIPAGTARQTELPF